MARVCRIFIYFIFFFFLVFGEEFILGKNAIDIGGNIG